MMFNFMCPLVWLKDAQITGKTFLSVSVRLFLEEISL